MESVKDLLRSKESFVGDIAERHKYVTKEFQDYGYRIAVKLGQTKQASLYIKLAKEKPRTLMDQAFSFAIDYPNAKNKGRLFMWKLKELEKEQTDKNMEDNRNKPEKEKVRKKVKERKQDEHKTDLIDKSLTTKKVSKKNLKGVAK